jgi:hypothetical protein
MAIRIPAGETNFSAVNPGDSIFKSVKRGDLLLEVFNHLVRVIQQYNRENPTLTLPVPQSDFNDDSGTATQSIVMQFAIDETTGEKYSRPARYTSDISSYAVPTTGILAGVSDAFMAYKLLVEQQCYINEKISPNVVVTSPAGLSNIDENLTQSEWSITNSTPFYANTDSLTGAIIKKAFNYSVFLDMQENLAY